MSCNSSAIGEMAGVFGAISDSVSEGRCTAQGADGEEEDWTEGREGNEEGGTTKDAEYAEGEEEGCEDEEGGTGVGLRLGLR